MKSTMRTFGLMLLIALPVICLGQTYNMPAGETVTCSGNFYDPGGSAANYSDASATTYISTFTAQSGDQLKMLFNSIALEGGDKLYIYDGPSTASTLIKVLDNTSLFGISIKSTTGSSVTFKFETDGNGAGAAGWSISIYCITKPDAINILNDVTPSVIVPCGGRTDFYDPGGFYTNYPAVAKTYTTTYTSAAGQRMMFYFYNFFTAFGDNLKIYDGNSTSAPLIGTYQGFVGTFNFNTSGDAVTFEFTVNTDAFSGTGWEAMATCINQVDLTCGGTSTYYDPAGVSKQYLSSAAGEDFITTYSVPAGQFIKATINNFYVDGNFTKTVLKVYDGSSTSSPLIATFSIQNFPSSFSLSSSGNSLTFSLETAYPSTCVANYDIVFECTSSQEGSLYTIGGSSSPMTIPCGVKSKVYALGGTSAYPETWQIPGPYVQTFTAPPGQYLQLVCERMYAANGDFINVYDGSSTASPLIASYSGPNNATGRDSALTFISTSNTLTVEIKTDGSAGLGGQGILADLTCVSATGANNFSLGNSPAPVTVSCGNGSTFEDNYGINQYIDNSVLNYVTTYTEVSGNPLYFVFSSFWLPAGDTLFVYDGVNTSAPLLGKYSGTLAPFSEGSATGVVTFEFKSNGINTFGSSGWEADISCNDPLPVVWTNFDVVNQNNNVKLEWSTALERDNHYFVVEKSVNGSDFIALDTLAGAGFFTSQSNYYYVDENPFGTISYYRIKQVDFDGTASYSPIKSITINELSVKLFPQPVSDRLFISFNNSENHEIKIHLTDELGKVLLSKSFYINNSTEIDMSRYAQGLYFLTVTEGAYSVTQKILKQ